MKKTAQALKRFYGGFGLKAYSENDVPSDATLPYITYPVVTPGSLAAGTYAKADEIAAAIGDGVVLDYGVTLRPGEPLMQKQPTEDNMQVIYINLQINTYHMIGA